METPVEHRMPTDNKRSSWVRRLALAVPGLGLGALVAVLFVVAAVRAAPLQQSNPIFTVTSADDTDDGLCDAQCTLREAINAANNIEYFYTSSTIRFSISGAGPHTIAPNTALPSIVKPVVIEGANLAGGPVVLDGQGKAFDGLTLSIGDSAVYSMTIRNFDGAGVYIDAYYYNVLSGNTIENNTFGVYVGGGGGYHNLLDNIIRNNGCGIEILDSVGNLVRGNQIYGNSGDGVNVVGATSANNQISKNDIHDNGEPIDLNDDGPTDNDLGDPDTGANATQNFPVLVRARPVGNTLVVQGYLNSVYQSYIDYTIEIFGGAKCDQGSQTYLPSTPPSVVLNPDGTLFFSLTINQSVPLGTAIRATATSQNFGFQASATNDAAIGNTSEMSDCVIAGPDNDSWPKALRTSVPTIAAAVSAAEAQELADAAGVTEVDATTGVVTLTQYIDSFGQSRWYKFKIRPNSQLIVTLTGLPENYDLTLYKDIEAEYQKLSNPQDTKDLVRLQAQSAPQAFAPQAFAPQAFAPQAFAPQAFAPQAFAPQAFAPQAFAPQAFAPQAFAPSAYSPDAFGASSFSAWAFDQNAFDPSTFDRNAYNPSNFNPKAFTSAQSRSLIGVSAFEGKSEEGLIMNTWLNDGDFYVRVRDATARSARTRRSG